MISIGIEELVFASRHQNIKRDRLFFKSCLPLFETRDDTFSKNDFPLYISP